jgi:transcriptional regulator with XRE-family HTH domain
VLFASKIRELRETKQMLQRHISAALDMDNAMYCKIEKGERRAKKEHIYKIAGILQATLKSCLLFGLLTNLPKWWRMKEWLLRL